ncbi:Glycine betaine methyltransferase [bioreactor metagenome]|uniref:Glycine betaine methyltransferase n=1 Tax=bioreactor metagenome TaxID=1076179 RepID=A0A645FP61_9ZZZZ
MARGFYNVPVMTGIMGTEARFPGWQAGVEDSLSCYTSVLCGADMMPGAGLLKNATTLSYEELLMGCEIYEMVRRTAEGTPVDLESLAVEVIGRVGPRKDYMMDEHTLANMNKVWQPEVMIRCSFDTWEKNNKRDAFENARKKAAWILENHNPKILSEEQEEALKAIISRY